MSFMKNKEKRTVNHLEQNIVKGMNCLKTIAQIIAVILYCLCLCHPYALHVHGLRMENLTLGPFHAEVKDYIWKLIKHPELLLSNTLDSYHLATLDGKPWSNPKVCAACMKLLPTHLNVKPLLVAGLTGALTCWECLTSEFKQGGAVDLSLDAEKELAFMASTNDANEGLLSMWQRFSWESPSSTVGHFEAQVMFACNETQEFMDTYMDTKTDHQFLRQEACSMDKSGVEKARWADLTAHMQKKVGAKLATDAKNTEKAFNETARLMEVGLKLDITEIKRMKSDDLKDQLEMHQQHRDKKILMLKGKKCTR
ncbi:hypothetical protein B0H17DRAFT_1214471 [Mycena rosella]|uniref:Uncharacterized protein n=1 Tax=Mycena rosella TaxID=1033263 RepID=A0AAD7CMZ8_MYCRO|nr:hypothetical protein B0H17DRAFT_1214471 [Mycena rosella]